MCSIGALILSGFLEAKDFTDSFDDIKITKTNTNVILSCIRNRNLIDDSSSNRF